jgi:hypothetical protein
VDLTERIFVSYEIQGDPCFVTHVAVYPSSASLPSKERIIERATTLIDQYPMLKACIVDARTTSPKWGILPVSKVGSGLATLVRDISVQEVQVRTTGCSEKCNEDIARTLQKIFDRELHDIQSISVSNNGFLWRVVRYFDGTDSNSDQPAYIAVTCHHVISDGRSGQALLAALLSDTALETSEKEKPAIPPSIEATINCRPRLQFMLEQVWFEIIVPKLPRFLANKLKKQPCWPFAPRLSRDPEQLEGAGKYAFNHIQLSADILKRLKDYGKANDVKTLQPTLQIAAVVALWIAVHSNPSKPDAFDDDTKGLHLVHACVASYRQSTLHPPISGNYASNLTSRTTCPGDGNVDFWKTVHRYATWLHSPATRRRGCELTGALRFIPDRDNRSVGDPLRPTGWEIFFLERAQRYPTDSLNVSNLGFYTLPPGAIRTAWSRTAMFTAPVNISIIGHDAGLDIDISRVMGAWIDETGYEPLAHFPAIYEQVLQVLVEPRYSIVDTESDSTLTFSDIQRRIHSMVKGE